MVHFLIWAATSSCLWSLEREAAIWPNLGAGIFKTVVIHPLFLGMIFIEREPFQAVLQIKVRTYSPSSFILQLILGLFQRGPGHLGEVNFS